MKLFYAKLQKTVFLVALMLAGFARQTRAQFTTAGDIAFTGYISAAPSGLESFSFVILKNIPAGSILNFTDRGWNGTSFNATTESLLTWTSGSALVAGREVTISGTPLSTTMSVVVSGSNISAGTVSGTMLSLPTSGDQILAYVGTVAAPTFIAGIHMNSYNNGNGGSECGSTSVASWDPAACANPGNANSSALPTGLTAGTTAVYIGVDNTFNSDFDNAQFACIGSLATPAQVRASVNTYTGSNWRTDNGTPTFSLPSGCAYLASIFPVDIISFTGSNESSFIGLQWQTANEPNDNARFEIEKSTDGQNFSRIGTVNAQGFSYLYNNYTYNDYNPLKGANFYRLKIASANGEVKYSTIVKLIYGNIGKAFTITPTVTNKDVTIMAAGNLFNQVIITDLSGRIVLRERLLTNNHKMDLSRLSPGQYAITLTGTTEKVTKKLMIVR